MVVVVDEAVLLPPPSSGEARRPRIRNACLGVTRERKRGERDHIYSMMLCGVEVKSR